MSDHEAIIVADLGFGDAGKGTLIDYLTRTRSAQTVVRFNGGAQAAHNVITEDGRHHTFSQFGSSMLVPRTRTHLSRFMLVDPIELAKEAQRLTEVGCPHPLARITIDQDALVVTPFHRAANRIRERLRAGDAHGTCGLGIGETMSDSLRYPDEAVYAADLKNASVLAQKYVSIQKRKRDELDEPARALCAPELEEELAILTDNDFAPALAGAIAEFSARLTIVRGEYLHKLAQDGGLLFEGAQGVLLDEWFGFHPHTTWSTTTFENAETLLKEVGFGGDVTKLGVLRAYHTRHGAGPFVTHDHELSRLLPEPHNGKVGWQGEFRCGWFDLVMARYAQTIAGADTLAVTHLDRYPSLASQKLCVGYEQGGTTMEFLPLARERDLVHQESLTQLLQSVRPIYEPAPATETEFLARVEQELRLKVSITSHGPTALDKQERG